MENLILSVIYDVFAVLITVATGYFVAWLRQKLGAEGIRRVHHELAAKQDLAIVGVKYAEQALRSALGSEKYRAAADWIKKQADRIGLDLSDEEIDVLVEWALREIKDQFGDQWAKAKQGG